MNTPDWLRRLLSPPLERELPSRRARREAATSRPHKKGQRFWTGHDRHEQTQHGGEDSSIRTRGF